MEKVTISFEVPEDVALEAQLYVTQGQSLNEYAEAVFHAAMHEHLARLRLELNAC